MFDSPRRATLISLVLLVLGSLAAFTAITLGGVFTVLWWALLLGLCATVPQGASTARSMRSRLVALVGLLASAVLLVGGAVATDSILLVLGIAVSLWVTLALMLTPQLLGHRIIGAALFMVPVALAGALLPLLVGPAAVETLPAVDLAAGAAAVAGVTGPILLLGGAALMIGTVVDLASRLRTTVSAETARSVAYVAGGLTLLLVAAAGAVAAGTFAGTATRIGPLGVLLVVASALAARRGLRGLLLTREVSHVGGVLGGVALAVLLLGTALAPTTGLVTALALAVLLGLASALGAVAGLCGAAAVVRARRERAPVRVRDSRLTQAVRSLRRNGFRTRAAQS